MSTLGEIPTIKIDLNGSSVSQEQEEIKRHIANVVQQMNRFKDLVSKYIEDNYVDFLPNNTSAYIHLEEGKHLEHESWELLRSLQWAASNVELKSSVENLKLSVSDIMVTNRILAADEILQYVDEANNTKEYTVILELLKKLKNILQDIGMPEAQTLFQSNPWYDTIRVKYLTQFHLVRSNIKDKFERLFQFSEKQLPNVVCATIQVSKDVNQLQDTVMALFQAQYNIYELCDFLMDKCLTPVITKDVNISHSEESLEYVKFQISYSTSANATKHEYKQVLGNIKLLFQCLENINISVSKDHHVFTIIGEHICDQFFKRLIDDCLMDAIPSTFEDYQSSTLVEDVLQFEHYLADLFFINREQNRTLGKLTDRFEILFRNNYFRTILDSGREIIKKDLQDIVLLAEKTAPEDVANNPLLFPKCMVSKSVLEFVKLLNRILRQDSDNPEEDIRLHNIISVLINSYINLVPQFHKEPLELLPQPAMLFYNNCFFLNHWIAENFGIPTVASIGKNLSATGNKYLKKQITMQLNILKNILCEEPKESSPNSSSHIIPITYMRKCLIHLKLLESLWQNVLPQKIYNRTMGELVSNCCYIINQNLMKKEHVSVLEIKQIVDLMSLFKNHAESFFKDIKELHVFNDWLRMVNLLRILEASLPEISEMWCSGLLPEYFKSDEVVHLIRSLHPNTERRALALKKVI